MWCHNSSIKKELIGGSKEERNRMGMVEEAYEALALAKMKGQLDGEVKRDTRRIGSQPLNAHA